MFKLSKIFKTISSLGFIAILIITYAYLINDPQVYLDSRKILSIDVETFFYYSLGLFVLLYLLFFIFERVLMSMNNGKKKKGFINSSAFLGWLNTFSISTNILLISYVVFIGFLNSENSLKMMNYVFLLYLGPILILACLILLPVLFIKHR